ncbi:MAG: isoprenylcysteine carboxylmethyltransferase family protein [Gammaproteobacteria bacterium]|nr:isoprenylcysteine carboxylmethyltransferase family protein [Gammaproteobacteria bacterium]MDH3371840.1 isoprenylcysteine carboxylmethyltransferase family protein [Gammaproteobacteria bacterium]MDH3546677.1 isoprenylcysteine carboxylmethyltransferase family protein [Gammaproteobacteria bacterium]
MKDYPRSQTAWLFVKASIFTLLVPAAVVMFAPSVFLADASIGAIDFLGMTVLGLIPIIIGTALYFRCAYEFVVSGRGTPAPIDPPVQLVNGGPYQVTRNPMYIAVLSILGGEALLYRGYPLLEFAVVLAICLHVVVIAYEERVLRRQFGETYLRYCETVPRWIPRWGCLVILYKSTFLRVGTMVLAAGTVAHAIRLAFGLPLLETPESIHSALVVLPAYAVIGCIVYARQFDLPRLHHKVIFSLITGLLFATAVMHAYSIVAEDNEWNLIFPVWYSAVAIIVYGGFVHFLKTQKLTLESC